MENRWKKIIARKASDVITADQLQDEPAEWLASGPTPEEFVLELLDKGFHIDATRVMANAMPRREAAWWACLCAREMEGVGREPSEQAALKAAEKWVYEPTREHRVAAFHAAQQCKTASGGLQCALAVAMVEGDLALGEGQTVEFDIGTFPNLVFATVFTAASEADSLDEKLAGYVDTSIEIAKGGSGKASSPPGE